MLFLFMYTLPSFDTATHKAATKPSKQTRRAKAVPVSSTSHDGGSSTGAHPSTPTRKKKTNKKTNTKPKVTPSPPRKRSKTTKAKGPAERPDSIRGRLLIAANTSHNAKPTQPPSVIYKAALNPEKVISFERLAAQQTPEGLYSLILYFSSSGPVVRMKCGINGCNATANPTDALPITCSSKTSPHLHHTYRMVPTLFTVIPSNSAHDCGPKSPTGLPIPATFSISTQVLEETLICTGEEYVNLKTDEQKSRCAWLLDDKYVAAVEKKRWGEQRRWAYHVVRLNNDSHVVARLQAARSRSHPTIDLSGADPTSASRKRTNRKPRSNLNRKKRPEPPTSYVSSASDGNADSDDALGDDDSDADNNNSNNEDVISDDDYSDDDSEPTSDNDDDDNNNDDIDEQSDSDNADDSD